MTKTNHEGGGWGMGKPGARKWLFLVLLGVAALLAEGAQAASPSAPEVTLLAPEGRSAFPGDLITYCFTLTSNAPASRCYQVHYRSEAGWQVLSDGDDTISLDPGQSELIALTVVVPADALAGTQDRLALWIATDAGLELFRAAVATKVEPRSDFDLTGPPPVLTTPGSKITLVFSLDNMGNVPDSFELAATSASGWALSPTKTAIDLGPLESRTIELTMTVPAKTNKGYTDIVTATIRSLSTGQKGVAYAKVTVGNTLADGEIAIGETNYLLGGEAGLSLSDPFTYGGYPRVWLRLAGPLDPGEWLELYLSGIDLPSGLTLTDLTFLYRDSRYQWRLGDIGSPWTGLVSPGTNRAGLDALYKWDNGRLELTIGTPETLTPTLVPQWYALSWFGHWSTWDTAVRLLQTDTGTNDSSSPYLDTSIDWRGTGQSLSVDLALGLEDFASAGSVYYGWAPSRLGLHGSLLWADRLNGESLSYSFLLGGDYRLPFDRKLALDLALVHRYATSLTLASTFHEAKLTYSPRRDLTLYALADDTWIDDAGWALDHAEYLVGLNYGFGVQGKPLNAVLELIGIDEPGLESTYQLRLSSTCRFYLGELPGEWRARLEGTMDQDPDGSYGVLSLNYADQTPNLTYDLGLALAYPSLYLSASAKLAWNLARDTRLTAEGVLTEDYLYLKGEFVHQFNYWLPRPHGTISGVVFQDLNQNGRRDPGEAGQSGIGIVFDGRQVGLSGADGKFILTGVTPGVHQVTVDCDDTGLKSASAPVSVSVTAGGDFVADMPVIRLTSLTGRAFIDLNEDCQMNDGDQVLAELPVVLTRPDGSQAKTLTARDGSFLFSDLVPGVYRLYALQDGKSEEIKMPEEISVTIAQEGLVVRDLVARTIVKPVIVTFIATPKLTAAATPCEVYPGGSTMIDITADMPLTRILVQTEEGVLAEVAVDDDHCQVPVRIPANQPPGPLTLNVRAWDGGGPGETQVQLMVIMPKIKPELIVTTPETTLAPGAPVPITVAADMTLSRVEVLLPGQEPQVFPANGPEWMGTIEIPKDQPPGPFKVTVRAWDGGTEPAEVDLLFQVKQGNVQPGYLEPLVVHFAVNSATITEEMYQAINLIGRKMMDDPYLRLRIIGHTDSTGTVQLNDKLSLQRALAIKQYLVKQFRIDPKRIECVGRGMHEPIADNETAEGRATNRRVEFIWLEIALAEPKEINAASGRKPRPLE